MAGSTDAEDLQVDPTVIENGFFILAAKFIHVLEGNRAIGNMNVGRRDVHPIEQMLVHEAVIALQFHRLHRKVFVEIERDDVLKAKPFVLMHSDEFFVDARGCGTGGEAENALLAESGFVANERRDF